MKFDLDPQLQQDCFVLGRLDLCYVLLLNNAGVHWFILVPETDVTEICDLPESAQSVLWAEVRALSEFVRAEYPVDKLNVAAIGNVVSQLHVHVVGRRKDDYCWPDVVWGRPAPGQYGDATVKAVAAKLSSSLSGFLLADKEP